MVNFSFKVLGILAILYAILGLLNIKVWIQFKGFQKLSQGESSIFLLVGVTLLIVSLINKGDAYNGLKDQDK